MYTAEAWAPKYTPIVLLSFISLDVVLPEDLSVNHKNMNSNIKQLYTEANLVFTDAAFIKVPLEATLLPKKETCLSTGKK